MKAEEKKQILFFWRIKILWLKCILMVISHESETLPVFRVQHVSDCVCLDRQPQNWPDISLCPTERRIGPQFQCCSEKPESYLFNFTFRTFLQNHHRYQMITFARFLLISAACLTKQQIPSLTAHVSRTLYKSMALHMDNVPSNARFNYKNNDKNYLKILKKEANFKHITLFVRTPT